MMARNASLKCMYENTSMVASRSPKEFKSEAKAAVDREVIAYHQLYPELRNFIWTQVLNGYHCVILPYFSPIPKEERLNSIKSIKDILKTRFEPGNYRFDESDMRWRHVGKFDGQVYLYDLAELKNGDNLSLRFCLDLDLNESIPVGHRKAHFVTFCGVN